MVNTFIVTDFGAVPDGKTDSTAAIQKALDKAADCMGTVIVPPGIYSVGKLKMHGKNVSLVGTSAWSFRHDGASVFELNTENTDCLIDITGAFGCNITGMCLNGKRLGKNIHGVKLYWDKYNGGGEEDTPSVNESRIGNFSGDALHFEHVWCFSVRHSMLHHSGGAGLYIDGWDAFIIDNWFSGNSGGGIVGGNVVASVTLTGNRVEWNKKGGFVFGNGDSFNITGNFFDRTYGPALNLGGKDKHLTLLTVSGNIFKRGGAYSEECPLPHPDFSSHLIMHNCEGASVVGNSAAAGDGDNSLGVLSPYYSFIIDDCKNCVIKDNVFYSGALKKNLILRGDNSTCVIKDNIGTLKNNNKKR